MNQSRELPPESAFKTAAIIKGLLELSADCIVRRTGDSHLAQEVVDDVRKGATTVEFVVRIGADSAAIIGIEHRGTEAKGLVDVTIVPDARGLPGIGH